MFSTNTDQIELELSYIKQKLDKLNEILEKYLDKIHEALTI